MPKETVPAWSDPASERNRIDVRWSKEDGHPSVALVTRCPSRRVSETVEVDAFEKVVPGSECREGFPFTGWYTELNRYELNELIKTLRRARDQVFGPDA